MFCGGLGDIGRSEGEENFMDLVGGQRRQDREGASHKFTIREGKPNPCPRGLYINLG